MLKRFTRKRVHKISCYRVRDRGIHSRMMYCCSTKPNFFTRNVQLVQLVQLAHLGQSVQLVDLEESSGSDVENKLNQVKLTYLIEVGTIEVW